MTLFARSLGQPFFYDSDEQHYGFRYFTPSLQHFCLLKLVRAVSSLNAMVELARSGYTQEINSIARILVECTTHIDFVLSDVSLGDEPSAAALEYVKKYFSDFARSSAADYRKPRVRQQHVHDVVGAGLDATSTDPTVDTEKLLSNVYLTFSSYVHARYPETMDLFGGEPGHFHVRGMLGTSKDRENLECVETLFTTVSQAAARIAQSFRLWSILESEPTLIAWYEMEVGRPSPLKV